MLQNLCVLTVFANVECYSNLKMAAKRTSKSGRDFLREFSCSVSETILEVGGKQ